MTTLQKAAAQGPGGAARLLRYFAMPIFLGLAGLALYLYVGTQDLDSIEQRSLNAGTLIQIGRAQPTSSFPCRGRPR